MGDVYQGRGGVRRGSLCRLLGLPLRMNGRAAPPPGGATPPRAPSTTVDLFQLRCAVAALVECVDRAGRVDLNGLRRVDAAVRFLNRVRDEGVGEALSAPIDVLLSTEDDLDGSRTRGAIGELAELTHVDQTNARALAAQMVTPVPPEQGRLFDFPEPRGGQ